MDKKWPGMKFEVLEGETEHITYSGKRVRRQTVFIRVGKLSLSRKAAVLGAVLIGCQILDGLLTYIGLSAMGVHMEGNAFLRVLMEAYGRAPVLFASKIIAIIFVVLLTFEAHRRRWIRPLIFTMILIYLALAVGPWIYIISSKRDVAATTGADE